MIEVKTSVGDRYILEDKDLLGHPIIQRDDNEAFRKLYDDRQEIWTIAHRAIRDGKEGYKRAIHQIMDVCQGME